MVNLQNFEHNASFLQVLIPDSIDLAVLEKRRMPFPGYKRERAYYLINTILEVSLATKDEEYVGLSSNILKKKIHNYRRYMEYLVKLKVIEIDGYFVIGGNCKQYRISPEYYCDFNRVEIIQDPKLVQLHYTQASKDACKKFPTINNAISKLEIDTEVYSFLTMDRQRKLSGEAPKELRENKGIYNQGLPRSKYKCPKNQFNKAIRALDKIKLRQSNLTQDQKVFRLHHILCSLTSICRPFISIAGKPLSTADLSNCQFLILNRILEPEFWLCNDNHININNLDISIYNNYKHLLLSDGVSTLICGSQNDEYQHFRNITQDGSFYSTLQTENYTREEVKKLCFSLLFSDPKAKKNRKIFTDKFPQIYNAIKILQLDDKQLPILLQNLESTIILNHVIPRIINERPDLPIIPIHDCIISLTSQIQAIKAIMIDEIAKCTGLRPHVKISHYIASEAKFKDGVRYQDYLLKYKRA